MSQKEKLQGTQLVHHSESVAPITDSVQVRNTTTDNRPSTAKQQLLQLRINQSQRVVESARMQRAINQSQRQYAAVRPGISPIQLQIDHSAPDVKLDNGRAGSVLVTNIRGETYGPSHNSPSINSVYGWQQLNTAGHTLGHQNTTHYNAVRMHLWNGRLDGPGDEKYNLAPGPAEINSSMSAGPETASKSAVDLGSQIWLRTSVEYANNTVTNPSDYTSVVPNKMTMAWGYMIKNGSPISKADHPGGSVMGPAQAPAWSRDIDPPLSALSALDKQAYNNWDTSDFAGLKNHLDPKSNQAKAQAYGELPNLLRAPLLNEYPIVYEQYLSSTQMAQAMLLFSNQGAVNFATGKLGVSKDSRGFYYFILEPLVRANQAAKVQGIAGRLSEAEVIAQLYVGKTELLSKLGIGAIPIIIKSQTLFNYLSEVEQARIYDRLSDPQKSTLFSAYKSKPARLGLARAIARANHYRDKPADLQLAYMEVMVPSEFRKDIKSAMKHFLGQSDEKRRKTRSMDTN